MIGFYNYTVILTYLSVLSAVVGISFAIQGNLFGAIVCLMISGACDMFDGTVAKTKQQSEMEKKFGIQIDALADLIAFGVFPAIIGYVLGLNRPYHFIILVVYILAALIRLAYFNVTEDELHQKEGKDRVHYDGLPVTTVAVLIPMFYCFRPVIGTNFSSAYGIFLVCVAAAFVSKIKVKKPKLKGRMALFLAGTLILLYLIARWWQYGM